MEEINKPEEINKSSNIRRFFKVDDWVVYKPYENCSMVNISGKGNIIEDLGDGMYLVTFGYRSMYGTRTGKYCWANLYPTDDTNALILQN